MAGQGQEPDGNKDSRHQGTGKDSARQRPSPALLALRNPRGLEAMLGERVGEGPSPDDSDSFHHLAKTGT